MTIKGTNVIGLKIFSLTGGKEIGKVQDLVYDPDDQRVKALMVDRGGLFTSPSIIMIEDIKNIGHDAIIIESENLLKKMSDVDTKIVDIAKGDTYVTKTKVITEDGQELGNISDIYFNSENGNVDQFEISQGLKDLQSGKKYINTSDIVTIGEDVSVVRSYTRDKIEEQGQKQGIQGFIQKGKDQGQQFLNETKETTQPENLKQKASYVMDRIDQKIDEIKQDPRVQEATESVKSKAENVSSQIQDKFGDVKSDVYEKRKKDAVGRYLTVNILSAMDEIIAKRGDMITNKIIKKAERNGVVEQVINNTSDKPINEV